MQHGQTSRALRADGVILCLDLVSTHRTGDGDALSVSQGSNQALSFALASVLPADVDISKELNSMMQH